MSVSPDQFAAIVALQKKVAALDLAFQEHSLTLKKLESSIPVLVASLLRMQSLRALPIVIAQLFGELALASPDPRQRLDTLLFAMSGPAEASLSNPDVRSTGIEIAKLHDQIRSLAEEHVATHLGSRG